MDAKQLGQWRQRLGLSQEGMARFLGIPVKTLQNWEQGYRVMPDVAQAYFARLVIIESLAPEIFNVFLEEGKE